MVYHSELGLKNFTSSFKITVNILHLCSLLVYYLICVFLPLMFFRKLQSVSIYSNSMPSSFLLGLLSSLRCFSILLNSYFQENYNSSQSSQIISHCRSFWVYYRLLSVFLSHWFNFLIFLQFVSILSNSEPSSFLLGLLSSVRCFSIPLN